MCKESRRMSRKLLTDEIERTTVWLSAHSPSASEFQLYSFHLSRLGLMLRYLDGEIDSL